MGSPSFVTVTMVVPESNSSWTWMSISVDPQSIEFWRISRAKAQYLFE